MKESYKESTKHCTKHATEQNEHERTIDIDDSRFFAAGELDVAEEEDRGHQRPRHVLLVGTETGNGHRALQTAEEDENILN